MQKKFKNLDNATKENQKNFQRKHEHSLKYVLKGREHTCNIAGSFFQAA